MPLPQHMVVERAAESGLLIRIDGSSAVAHAFTTERDFAEWVINQLDENAVRHQPIDGDTPPTGGYPRVVAGQEPTLIERGLWGRKR